MPPPWWGGFTTGLVERYGKQNVFMDVDTIPAGVRFDQFIGDAVARADLLLVVIGPQWVEQIQARAGEGNDYVRLEIESALARSMTVVPVLIGGARVPQARDLPESLASLVLHNAYSVDTERDFNAHVTRLIADLDRNHGGKKNGLEVPFGIVLAGVAIAAAGLFVSSPWKERPVGITTGPPAESATKPIVLAGKDFKSSARIEMVWCPPGTFLMGSPESEPERGQNETQHEVTLSKGFWMARHEVTQGQWTEQMGSNPSEFKDAGDQAPVDVLLDEAMQFCRKLTDAERAKGMLPANHAYTLPTEAQWEYACRAGTTHALQFSGRFSTGLRRTATGIRLYGTTEKGPTREKTAPVGSYPANAWRLHDMHGNVNEWCLDWYEKLPSRKFRRSTRAQAGHQPGRPGRRLVLRFRELPRGLPQRVRTGEPHPQSGVPPSPFPGQQVAESASPESDRRAAALSRRAILAAARCPEPPGFTRTLNMPSSAVTRILPVANAEGGCGLGHGVPPQPPSGLNHCFSAASSQALQACEMLGSCRFLTAA